MASDRKSISPTAGRDEHEREVTVIPQIRKSRIDAAVVLEFSGHQKACRMSAKPIPLIIA